jgi:putative acetyltransferase
MVSDMNIRLDDLSDPATQALVHLHLEGMHANSPPSRAFALGLSALQKPDVTLWTAWAGEEILGMGALKRLDPWSGEVKSMRTHPMHLRRGVASALLEQIIQEARARGYIRLSLETGSGAAFEPALTLYRRRGFVDGDPFGDYTRSDFNQFLHLRIDRLR